MTDLSHEKEAETPERPAVSGCGENHACHEAKAEEIEITEEVMSEAMDILAEHHSDNSDDLDKEIIKSLFGVFYRSYQRHP